MNDCLVFQEGYFIEEGNFAEKWFFRCLRRLAMLKIDYAACFAILQGSSLSPAFEKHSGLSTDVRSQNCCSCLDANNLICDRGIRIEGSRKFVHGKKHFPS
ncbi:hypothetical protein YC2023_081369 [Brassica napus]